MNILITGGAGFIGSNLAEYLLKFYHKITVIDDCSTGVEKNISKLGVDFIYLDISTYSEKLEKAIQLCDVCYHLAGSIGVKYIIENPKSTLHNSYNINNTVFPLFEKYNTKVIFASTSEVYGESPLSGSKESDTLKIGSPDISRWGYACCKLMSEFLIRSYTFPSVIVRFFNIVGKNQISTYGMVLPSFIEKAMNNEDLIIHGDGTQIRSFCDIRDAVIMLKHMIDPVHNNQIYNIGNAQNNISITELAVLCIQITKSKSQILHKKYEEVFNNNFKDIKYRTPNTEKFDKVYKAKHNIRDIIYNIIRNENE